MNTSLHSPPRPLLLPETPFSQRKRTPFRASQPPKAPAKSCPPVSRVFPTPRYSKTGPRFVSFKSERKPDGKKVVLIYLHVVFEKHNKWYGTCNCIQWMINLGLLEKIVVLLQARLSECDQNVSLDPRSSPRPAQKVIPGSPLCFYFLSGIITRRSRAHKNGRLE